MVIQGPSWSQHYKLFVSNKFLNTFCFRNPATYGKRLRTQERSRGRQSAHFCEISNTLETTQAIGHFRMCSAIPRLLEHSETSRMFQNHPEQIRVNSSISQASRRSEQYRNAPENFRYDPKIPSPTVDIWSITQHAKKSRISAVKPRTSQTVVWFSRAADSSSVLCGHDFLIGLGEFPFMERRKESVLFILRELLEPKWWPGVLR